MDPLPQLAEHSEYSDHWAHWTSGQDSTLQDSSLDSESLGHPTPEQVLVLVATPPPQVTLHSDGEDQDVHSGQGWLLQCCSWDSGWLGHPVPLHALVLLIDPPPQDLLQVNHPDH